MLSSFFVIIACLSPNETIKSGEWSIGNAKTSIDSCNINKYRNLKRMIPANFKIAKTTPNSFYAKDKLCIINNYAFTCEPLFTISPALRGAAKMRVKTIMNGRIKSSSFMKLNFGITIESCQGFGCFFINKVLDFPCLANVEAEGKI